MARHSHMPRDEQLIRLLPNRSTPNGISWISIGGQRQEMIRATCVKGSVSGDDQNVVGSGQILVMMLPLSLPSLSLFERTLCISAKINSDRLHQNLTASNQLESVKFRVKRSSLISSSWLVSVGILRAPPPPTDYTPLHMSLQSNHQLQPPI